MNWQLSKSDIRWQLSHDHLAGSDEKTGRFALDISWYNITHLPKYEWNETTLSQGRAVSSLYA